MTDSLHALADAFRRLPLPVVIVDLETTGGDLLHDRITEIALLHFRQGRVTAWQQLVNPHLPIGDFVRRLTGICDEMVADAPDFADVAAQILPLLRGSLIIAHNSKFDYTFLRHAFARAGLDFAAPTLCSVRLSRRLYPQFDKHSLDSIIGRHGLAAAARHRAMDDAEVLARFLQAALNEHGADVWLDAASALIQPQLPPEHICAEMVQAAYALPDSCGVSVWFDGSGRAFAVHRHQQAFHEVSALLRRSEYAQAERLAFEPAAGMLHAAVLRAQLMQRHGVLPENAVIRHTVLVQEVSGCLKTRVRPLRAGFYAAPPHGLFMNAKAAKRGVAAWAEQFGLCPNLLGILPDELPKNAPCPVSQAGRCSAACETGNIAAHNAAVRAALPHLPVCDWGVAPRVCISERDELRGYNAACVCDSGALLLPDGGWFCDSDTLAVLKHMFKTAKRHIQAA